MTTIHSQPVSQDDFRVSPTCVAFRDERRLYFYVSSSKISLLEAKRDWELVDELMGSERFSMFVDYSFSGFPGLDVRNFWTAKTKEQMLVVAGMTGSTLAKLFGHFMIGLTATFVKAKLFTKPEDAMEWLQSFDGQESRLEHFCEILRSRLSWADRNNSTILRLRQENAPSTDQEIAESPPTDFFAKSDVEKIQTIVISFAERDFSGRIDCDNIQDENLRVVAHSIDALGDELQYTTVSKRDLEEQNAFLNTIVESIPLPLIVKDVQDNFRVTHWNHSAEKILGYPRKKVLGQRMQEILPSSEAVMSMQSDQKVVESKTMLEIPQIEMDIPGRGKVVFSIKKVPILVPSSSNFKYLVSIFEDLSERIKTSEEALHAKIELQNSEQQLRNLINGAPALVSYWGSDLRNVIANDRYLEYFGKTSSQMKGLALRDMVADSMFEKTKPLIERVLKGRSEILENTVRTPTGSMRHLRVHYQPNILDGVVNGYYVVATDVTQEKESQRLLEEAQRLAKIGSWSYSILEHKVRWSIQMFKIFSMDPANEPPTMDGHLANIHPDDCILWRETIDRAIIDKKPYKIRYRGISSSGIVWLESIGSPELNGQGELTELRGTTQDVTEIVVAEKKIELEREKAMQASRLASLGEMAGGIAHEINNPIAIIDGSAHRVLKLLRRHPINLGEIEDFMLKIRETTERIVKIVAGLRSFSRNSEADPHTPFDIRDLWDDVFALCKERLQHHQVKLSVDFDASNTTIWSNRTQISQVLFNLINNADDAMATTTDKWLRIHVSENATRLEISLTNGGDKISDEVRAKLFTPFFTTKDVGKGTGLGLSVSRKIAEAHSGTLELDEACEN